MATTPVDGALGSPEQSAPSNRELAETLFTRAGPSAWRCALCAATVAQAPRKGYTNLRSHLRLRHRDDFLAAFRTRQRPGASASAAHAAAGPRADTRADTRAWLEWLVVESRDPVTLETSALSPPGLPPRAELRQRLDDAHRSLVAAIEAEVAASDVLGLAVDAWTRPLDVGRRAAAVIAAAFAVLPSTDTAGSARRRRGGETRRRALLLGLSVTPHYRARAGDGDAEVAALVALVGRAAAALAIDARRVAFLVGTPSHTSAAQQALARRRGRGDIPVVSCAVEQLAAAAHAVLHRGRGRQDVATARAALAAALALASSAAHSPSLVCVLSTITVSMAVDDPEGDADWLETLAAVDAYLELHAAVSSLPASQEGVGSGGLERLLVPDDTAARLRALQSQLRDLASVRHKLSLRSGAPLHLVRRLLDAVRDHIAGCADALPVTGASSFERGVVAVLQGRERALTAEERRVLALLRLGRGGGGDSSEDGADDPQPDEELSFADAAILAATDGGAAGQSKYLDLWWVPSTAADRERLFPTGSAGALAMCPLTAEKLALLRYNREQWVTGAPATREAGEKRWRASPSAGGGDKRTRAAAI